MEMGRDSGGWDGVEDLVLPVLVVKMLFCWVVSVPRDCRQPSRVQARQIKDCMNVQNNTGAM